VGKALGPLKSPEIYEWEVTQCHELMLIMCCDRFFSKNAFKSTEHLVEFLVNPMDYFTGVCSCACVCVCEREEFIDNQQVRERAGACVPYKRLVCPQEPGTGRRVRRKISPDETCESKNVCGGLFERASRAAPGSCQV
jgi:hypothetical protein